MLDFLPIQSMGRAPQVAAERRARTPAGGAGGSGRGKAAGAGQLGAGGAGGRLAGAPKRPRPTNAQRRGGDGFIHLPLPHANTRIEGIYRAVTAKLPR